MRSLLTFMVNAPFVTFLDDDNRVAPNHLSSLYRALKNRKWAYSRRLLLDEDGAPLCIDDFESCGPNGGIWAEKMGGFSDLNCLMVHVRSCQPFLSALSQPLFKQLDGRSEDKKFFTTLLKLKPYGTTHQASLFYKLSAEHPDHARRLKEIKGRSTDPGPLWQAPPKPHIPPGRKTKTSGQLISINAQAKPFDITVIITSIGRRSLLDAVRCISEQDYAGPVQILVGLDKTQRFSSILEEIQKDLPDNRSLMIFDPGYSTSKRHGGQHPAYDGGALRSILSYLAHAPYVTYLDDDNSWLTHHLSSLHKAIQGKDCAFSLRRFIHPNGKNLITTDRFESTGPKRGLYITRFNGFVDPNCLMLDVKRCLSILSLWSLPLPNDPEAMSADRHIFHALQKRARWGETAQASVNYVLSPDDPMYEVRRAYLEPFWTFAELNHYKRKLFKGD